MYILRGKSSCTELPSPLEPRMPGGRRTFTFVQCSGRMSRRSLTSGPGYIEPALSPNQGRFNHLLLALMFVIMSVYTWNKNKMCTLLGDVGPHTMQNWVQPFMKGTAGLSDNVASFWINCFGLFRQPLTCLCRFCLRIGGNNTMATTACCSLTEQTSISRCPPTI